MTSIDTSASQINLFEMANRNSSFTLMRQAKNRMNELIGRTDIQGSAGVELNRDGTYEVKTLSMPGDEGALKSAVETAFKEDKTLTDILEKLKIADAEEKAKAEEAKNNPATPHQPLRMISDSVEISDESRAMMQAVREQAMRNNKFIDNTIYVSTARTDRGQFVFGEESQLSHDANAAFRQFTGLLLDDADAAGEFANDFEIGLSMDNALYIAGVRGRDGGEATETVEEEKTALSSILDKLNQGVKSGAGDDDSKTLQALRKFLNIAADYDEISEEKPLAQSKFPFTLRTSHTMW